MMIMIYIASGSTNYIKTNRTTKKIEIKTTIRIFQATKCQTLTQVEVDIGKKGKIQERN